MELNNRDSNRIQSALEAAVGQALQNEDGHVATYIPELANVSPDITAVAVQLNSGEMFVAGEGVDESLTLQSVAKLVVLIGLLEEYGRDRVFDWVRVEPSGDDFFVGGPLGSIRTHAL